MGDIIKELLKVAKSYREYVSALPEDIDLPVMPGHDRDWSDSVIAIAEKMTDQSSYGCHCDLENTISEEPDECVLDSTEFSKDDCIYAKNISCKEECGYWRKIKK